MINKWMFIVYQLMYTINACSLGSRLVTRNKEKLTKRFCFFCIIIIIMCNMMMMMMWWVLRPMYFHYRSIRNLFHIWKRNWSPGIIAGINRNSIGFCFDWFRRNYISTNRSIDIQIENGKFLSSSTLIHCS